MSLSLHGSLNSILSDSNYEAPQLAAVHTDACLKQKPDVLNTYPSAMKFVYIIVTIPFCHIRIPTNLVG
jgi:hypothetical protein